MEGGEFGGDFCGSEEELEGFAGKVDARGEGVEGELFARRKRGARLGVVEDEAAVGQVARR